MYQLELVRQLPQQGQAHLSQFPPNQRSLQELESRAMSMCLGNVFGAQFHVYLLQRSGVPREHRGGKLRGLRTPLIE